MMTPLPSEETSHLSTILATIVALVGGGGALKIFTEWQAGRAAIRAEHQTRIHQLEQMVTELQKQIGDLRAENGGMRVELDILRKK